MKRKLSMSKKSLGKEKKTINPILNMEPVSEIPSKYRAYIDTFVWIFFQQNYKHHNEKLMLRKLNKERKDMLILNLNSSISNLSDSIIWLVVDYCLLPKIIMEFQIFLCYLGEKESHDNKIHLRKAMKNFRNALSGEDVKESMDLYLKESIYFEEHLPVEITPEGQSLPFREILWRDFQKLLRPIQFGLEFVEEFMKKSKNTIGEVIQFFHKTNKALYLPGRSVYIETARAWNLCIYQFVRKYFHTPSLEWFVFGQIYHDLTFQRNVFQSQNYLAILTHE